MNMAYIVTGLLTIAGCFMIACRVDKMIRGVTMPFVFIQHAAIGVGMFGGFVLMFTEFSDWSPASVAAGVVVFFAFSAKRWMHGPPEGTTKPGDLDASVFHQISGGKKS